MNSQMKMDCVGAAIRNLFERPGLKDFGFVMVIVPLAGANDGRGSLYANVDEIKQALEDALKFVNEQPDPTILPEDPEATQH